MFLYFIVWAKYLNDSPVSEIIIIIIKERNLC